MGSFCLFLLDMNPAHPIGIFDSGMGGLTILKALQKKIPHESFVYLSDNKHAPYGEKSVEEVINISLQNSHWLLGQKAKLIVVACNTATTSAIATLRAQIDCPFVGIEPAIKPAALTTKTGIVGVLATKGTLSSSLFHQTAKTHASGIEIIEQVGHGIVELIESGAAKSMKMHTLLSSYLQPMVEKGMDTLVLGCTHYPLLLPLMKNLVPPTIKIMDSSEAVARQTAHLLRENQLLNPSEVSGQIKYFYTGNGEIMQRFLGADTLISPL